VLIQEQHKQLLESCNKTEKLCEQRNMQIQMVERQITEVKFQLEKSKELLMITNESLKVLFNFKKREGKS